MQPHLQHAWLRAFLTATVALLLVAAIHTVGVKIAAPADGDAVAVFALELIAIAPHVTAILGHRKEIESISAPTVSGFKAGCDSERSAVTSSEPSAQSWSPSHFQRPAMQRPFVQANSLSEHCRGTEGGDESLGG